MTDPVDTDALRAIAQWFEAKGWVNNANHCRAAADELDRLRAVIEDAPHGPDCSWPYAPDDPAAYNDVCDCWKSHYRAGAPTT